MFAYCLPVVNAAREFEEENCLLFGSVQGGGLPAGLSFNALSAHGQKPEAEDEHPARKSDDCD
jgi:hypothetical protein